MLFEASEVMRTVSLSLGLHIFNRIASVLICNSPLNMSDMLILHRKVRYAYYRCGYYWKNYASIETLPGGGPYE